MGEIKFHYRPDAVTPELLQAIGQIMIRWALLDMTVAHTCLCLWQIAHTGKKMPQSFRRRMVHLKEMTRTLYKHEPDEWRTMAYFIQRLSNANGIRDDVAHGVPGTITKAGRSYVGLHVIMPGEMPKTRPMTVEDLNDFHDELHALDREASDVSLAISAAIAASSQNILVWPNPDGLKPVSPGPRSPMLPRDHRPPSTFRP